MECLCKKDILSIKEITREEISLILKRAHEMKTGGQTSLLQGRVMASCFFEPSTRTRLSFESAMRRLGGGVIGFTHLDETSAKKGESFDDAMKTVGLYSDVIVLRHPQEGAASVAAAATNKPVINAGDGANEHPTQTLLDLFSIEACQGRLDGLNIAFMGDLLYGRTVHSLALAMNQFNNRLYFVAPPSLALPDWVSQQLHVPLSFHTDLEEVIDKIDLLYVTRMQQERHPEKIDDSYTITVELLEKGPPHLKVLHPLPRQEEIERAVDATSYAYYFNQAENGLYVRQALLAMVLNS